MRAEARPLVLPVRAPRSHGFTLVEMILVILIGGVIAATLTVFARPALEAYLATRSRADLVAQADLALRRLTRDLRAGVPNAIRIPAASCIELLPASTGGRYRAGPDTQADASPGCGPAANCAARLDTTQSTSSFDVLGPLPALPAVGDQVVVGNQSPEQVYGGSNRASITALSTPAASQGSLRISIAATQFPNGYDGGRFLVVPAAQGPVFYVCEGADGSVDGDGNARGRLLRLAGYGYQAAYPSSCPNAAAGDVLATQVASCQFVYNPSQGATQQHGHVWLQLQLRRRGETVTLAHGAHVDNAP